MYLAYLDESGDPGVINSPTTHFVLSCVLVHDSRWLETLDGLIDMRRRLRDRFGIPPSAEIKASHFKVQKGVFRQVVLPIDQRMKLFRGLLTYQARELPIKVFAVAIQKAAAAARGYDSRRAAWKFALQRIHTFCKKVKASEYAMIFPDEGHGFFIRRLMRELRRHHTVPNY
jgi:hypothetical protein